MEDGLISQENAVPSRGLLIGHECHRSPRCTHVDEDEADAVTIEPLNTHSYLHALRTVRSQLAEQRMPGCLAHIPESYARHGLVAGLTQDDESREEGYGSDVFDHLQDDARHSSTLQGSPFHEAEERHLNLRNKRTCSDGATHSTTPSWEKPQQQHKHPLLPDGRTYADMPLAHAGGKHDANSDPLARLTKRREELLLMHSRRFTKEQRKGKWKTREQDTCDDVH
uniref:Uncharacterized protein n=1 Tax=Toxoplasma gondii (strain ATCC 50861 / VEG) TaxID=432359 RepID=A0A0F7UNG1_TOXGV|nr:TPA: hypothetical protein BN1205_014125 [Toxoplasma gondii VEG]